MKNFNEREQVLPYNLFAERLVIGSLLTNPGAINIVSQYLPVESFYIELHRTIYKAVLTLHNNNQPIDFITVITWLQDNAQLNHIDEIFPIIEFFNSVSLVSELDNYVALIYDKFLRRELIELGKDIIEEGFSASIPLEQSFAEIEEKFLAIVQKQQIKKESTTSDILTKVLLEIKQRLKTSTLPGLSSTFYDLDAITQGFHNSDLIIIAGRPSMGKTAFALNLANKIAQYSKVGVIFFSLEMTKEQLIYRMLANETSINNSRLRSGRISRDEWIKVNTHLANLAKLPIFIDDTPNISVAEIHLKIKNLKQAFQNEIGLIVIDYLQLLETINKNDNRTQELAKITRSLKKLARENDIPIIVLSQLSRNVETRANKRPTLSDLRESGSIEQDADVVIMLYRDEYYNKNTLDKDLIEIIVAKQRNGPIGTAKLKFNAQSLNFYNLS